MNWLTGQTATTSGSVQARLDLVVQFGTGVAEEEDGVGSRGRLNQPLRRRLAATVAGHRRDGQAGDDPGQPADQDQLPPAPPGPGLGHQSRRPHRAIQPHPAHRGQGGWPVGAWVLASPAPHVVAGRARAPATTGQIAVGGRLQGCSMTARRVTSRDIRHVRGRLMTDLLEPYVAPPMDDLPPDPMLTDDGDNDDELAPFLRYLLAACLFGAAAIHLAMVPGHMSEWAAEGVASSSPRGCSSGGVGPDPAAPALDARDRASPPPPCSSAPGRRPGSAGSPSDRTRG